MSVNKPLFTIITIAALSLLSAGSAMAAGEFIDAPAPTVVSTTTRAAVQAEVLAARAAGTLVAGGEYLVADKAVAISGRTRAEVRAEVLAARAAGTLVAGGEILSTTQPAAARSLQASHVVAQHGKAAQQ
jgi:hypothetical protein